MVSEDALLQELYKERRLRQEVEEDRDRLKRARDELAKQCLALEERAVEAEEGLAKAQEELEELTSPPEKSARALQRDVEFLLKELEREQETNKKLTEELESAKEDSNEAIERMLVAERQVKMLRSSLHAERAKFHRQSSAVRGDINDKRGKGTEMTDAGRLRAEEDDELSNASDLDSHKVLATLKQARDRLITEMDAQASEIELLGQENSALASAVVDAKNVAAGWEAQAQAGLAQCSMLKDLLEESARWEEELDEMQKFRSLSDAGTTMEVSVNAQDPFERPSINDSRQKAVDGHQTSSGNVPSNGRAMRDVGAAVESTVDSSTAEDGGKLQNLDLRSKYEVLEKQLLMVVQPYTLLQMDKIYLHFLEGF